VWLTQLAMSELFETTKQNISLHLKNIFSEGELEEESVVKEYLTTAADWKNYRTKMYNLEAIISVGYRVRSHRGYNKDEISILELLVGQYLDFAELQVKQRNPMTMDDHEGLDREIKLLLNP